MVLLNQVPAWGWMWGIALALYGMGKGVTVFGGSGRGGSVGRWIAYLVLVPGMDAAGFMGGKASGKKQSTKGEARVAMRCAGNVAAGAAVVWGLVRVVATVDLRAGAWLGMAGLVMMIHFGVLQLACWAWREAGDEVPMLMREPLRARSVGEFWGVRWNTAFRELSHRYVFLPVARRMGARAGMGVTFLVSGVVHEMVISVPAWGGWGLPTGYFVLQGLGVAAERSAWGRRWLGGWVGRGFAWVVVAGPVGMLFHPAFVMRVMVPFLAAIGALPREVMA